MTELLQVKAIARNTRGIPFPYCIDDARRWVEQQTEAMERGEASVFAITLKTESAVVQAERSMEQGQAEKSEAGGDGLLIGCVGLAINHADENAELGFWLGEPYWNQGYMTEAARAVLEHGFESLGLHRIHAHHMSRNLGSGRVLEKIGMRPEGRLQQHIRKWGVYEDVELYGLLAGQWRAEKGAGEI